MPPLALLTAVPSDLSLSILSFLSPHTLTTCAATSSTLKSLSLHDVLWQALLLKHPAARPLISTIPTSPTPSTCYAKYIARSLDAARTFVTRAELLQGRWRFVFHHSIPFSLMTSLSPTFDETHCHAHPFGSYPYFLFDRERRNDGTDSGPDVTPFLDPDGLPFPPIPSTIAPPLSAYERLGFLTPAMKAECERLWAEHDDGLHHPSRHHELLATRSEVFARSAVPFTVLHLIDLMMTRSLCFTHLPLFTTERVEGGRWRLNNQLGAFESLRDDVPAGEAARSAAEDAEEEQVEGEGPEDAGEEDRREEMAGRAFFELNDWLEEADEEQW